MYWHTSKQSTVYDYSNKDCEINVDTEHSTYSARDEEVRTEVYEMSAGEEMNMLL